MATYLVDYENVKTGGLNGISRLTAEDHVIIFYSENANRLTFDLHQRLMASPAKIEYREVSVGGHNALDFQLVTYLGYLIANDRGGQYMIISYDRGFEYVVGFWRKEGLQIGLFPYLKDPAYALSRVSGQNDVPAGEPSADEPEAKAEEAEAEPEVTFTDGTELSDAPAESPAETSAEEIPAAEGSKVTDTAEPPVKEEPVKAEPAKEPVKKEEPVRVAKISPSTPVLEEKIAPKKEKAPKAEKPAHKKPIPVRPSQPLEEKIAPKKTEEKQPELAPVEEKPQTESPAETVSEPAPAAKKQTSSGKKPAKKSSPKPQPKSEEPAPAEPSVADVTALIAGLLTDPEEIAFVKSSVEKYKTKQGLNNALMKQFDSQKAGEIYQALKPAIKNLRGR